MQDAAPAAARLRGSGFRDWFRSVVPDDAAAPSADPGAPETALAPTPVPDPAGDLPPSPERVTADRFAQPTRDLSAIDHSDQPARHPLLDRFEPAIHRAFPPLPNSSQPEPPPAPAPSSPDLAGLEKQLRFLTTQLEIMRSPCRADALIAELRQQLANISQAIENVVPRSAFQVLEDEVRALAARLDDNRSGAADGAAFAALEQGLADIRNAVHGVTPVELDHVVQTLSRKIDQINEAGPDPLIFRQLDAAIDALRDIVNQIASGDALATLAKEVRALGEKVEQAVTASPRGAAASSSEEILLALEKQISGMVEALAHSAQADRAVASPIEPLIETIAQKLDRFDLFDGKSALEPIKQHINELGEKIDRLHAPPNETAGLTPLEKRLNDLADAIERLNRPAGQLPALAPIEERLSALAEKLDRIENNSRRSGDAAPLEERISHLSEKLSVSEPGAPQGIERAMVEVTSSPAEMRKSPGGEPRLAGTANPAIESPAQPVAGDARLRTDAHKPQNLWETQAASVLQAATAPAANALAAETMLAHDAPLEPGSGPPRGRSAAGASGRAGSRAARGAAAPDRTDKPPAWPNFIVAARRAAKAASEHPFQPVSATESTDHAAAGVVTRNLAERVKSLFLSTSLILVGLGAAGIALSSADLLGVGRQKTADRLVASAQMASAKVASAQTAAPKTVATAPAVPPQSRAAEPTPTSDAAPAMPPGRKPTSDVGRTALAEPGPVANETPVPEPRPARAGNPPAKPASAGSAEPAPPRRVAARPAEGAGPRSAPSDVTASIGPQHNIARSAVPQLPSKSAGDTSQAWSEPLPTAIATKAILAGIAERNPAAAYEVALRYVEGRGVTTDVATAAIWLARAAEGGIAPAQFRLGSMYEKGVGVKKNLMEARRLYLAAAAKGHATAMHNAAVLNAEGIDGRPDHAAAAEWFQKAAEYGVTDSQYNLAILYARGLGVERNFAESLKWFTIAAEKGDKDAAQKRDEIAARLDPQTLAAAQRAASAFTPKPQPEEATSTSPPPGGWEDGTLGRSKSHARYQGQQARL